MTGHPFTAAGRDVLTAAIDWRQRTDESLARPVEESPAPDGDDAATEALVRLHRAVVAYERIEGATELRVVHDPETPADGVLIFDVDLAADQLTYAVARVLSGSPINLTHSDPVGLSGYGELVRGAILAELRNPTEGESE